MGLDPNQLAETPGASPPIDPSFIPTCPGCNYDLRGIPDGVCPECGRPFERRSIVEELERNWAAQLAYRNVSPDVLMIVLVILTALQLPAYFSTSVRHGGDLSEFWPFILWIGTIYWAWRGRWVIFRPSLLRLSWFLVPIVWGVLPFISGRPTAWGDLSVSGLGTGAIILIWAFTRPWRLWVPLALGAALLLSPSIAIGLVGGGRMFRGLTWSNVPDLRIGQIYQQYPLRNDELVLLGLSGVAPGLVLAAVAMVVSLTQKAVQSRSGTLHAQRPYGHDTR